MKEFEDWCKFHEFYKYSDYSTKDLADFLKVSPRTIQRWINGTASPDSEKLEKIKIYLQERSKNPPSSPEK